MKRVFNTVDELIAAVDEPLGHSDWVTIDQDRINEFAEATGDYQWIHVDPERATSGPFGATIAHGYLTLALVPVMVGSLVDYAGWPVKINYGSNRVRFAMPVKVDSRVRGTVQIADVVTGAAGIQVTMRVTVEIDGEAKPALIAETITLLAQPARPSAS